MIERPEIKAPKDGEAELAKKESKFVSETAKGLSVDNSQAEGEPFDFGFDEEEDNR